MPPRHSIWLRRRSIWSIRRSIWLRRLDPWHFIWLRRRNMWIPGHSIWPRRLPIWIPRRSDPAGGTFGRRALPLARWRFIWLRWHSIWFRWRPIWVSGREVCQKRTKLKNRDTQTEKLSDQQTLQIYQPINLKQPTDKYKNWAWRNARALNKMTQTHA